MSQHTDDLIRSLQERSVSLGSALARGKSIKKYDRDVELLVGSLKTAIESLEHKNVELTTVLKSRAIPVATAFLDVISQRLTRHPCFGCEAFSTNFLDLPCRDCVKNSLYYPQEEK